LPNITNIISAMEIKVSDKVPKFSAFNHVVTEFLESCDKWKVDPLECLQAIQRFFGVSAVVTGAEKSAPQDSHGPSKSVSKLTKEEFERAKKAALNSKALRLKVSPKEVVLTSKEIDQARSEAVEKKSKLISNVAAQGVIPETTLVLDANPKVSSKKTKEKKGEQPVAPVKEATGLVPPKKAKKPQQAPEVVEEMNNLRLSMKSKRKLVLASLPTGILNPMKIHLVAYWNHTLRLKSEYQSFIEKFPDEEYMDPLRSLPSLDEDDYPTVAAEVLDSAASVKLVDSSDPKGTYSLSSPIEGSFWKGAQPSSVCPEPLKEPISQQSLDELSSFFAPKSKGTEVEF
jgi:hypothetical protein